MSRAVTVSVDAAGRLFLPRAIREKAGLKPGILFEVVATEGHIEMKPASQGVRLVREGRLMVAVADAPLPPLTEREVLTIRADLRQSRSES